VKKSHVTRTGTHPFEASTGQNAQYYVGVVKDKRTGKNGLEFLIGWRDLSSHGILCYSMLTRHWSGHWSGPMSRQHTVA
jgi:hypothetical protein